MKILILNWRDSKSPAAGGAEILTHEMAKRWVDAGNTVIQFSAAFPHCKPNEVVDGIQIIRRGQWWNVQVHAFFHYLFYLRKQVDVVIDEVHWFPFFAKLYSRKKIVLLACEVAHNLFYELFPRPVAHLLSFLEKMYLKMYRDVPTLVISSSTRNDFLQYGFDKKKLYVLSMGLTTPKKINIPKKEKSPTVVYLGRLNKQKGILDAIEAFYLMKQTVPESKFWIIGSGTKEYKRLIHKKLREKKIIKDTIMYGFVKEKEKFTLLAKAHVLVVPSRHEGWGLIVPEAGRVKTPAVVYDVSGLRDIIVNNKSGKVVETNPQSLAKGVIDLLTNKKLYATVQRNIYQESMNYSWDRTAQQGLTFIKTL